MTYKILQVYDLGDGLVISGDGGFATKAWCLVEFYNEFHTLQRVVVPMQLEGCRLVPIFASPSAEWVVP